jgi:hypothetical protein
MGLGLVVHAGIVVLRIAMIRGMIIGTHVALIIAILIAVTVEIVLLVVADGSMDGTFFSLLAQEGHLILHHLLIL